MSDSSATGAPEKARTGHGFRTFIIVIVLMGAAFGGGWYWGESRLRQGTSDWNAEKQKLETSLADTQKSLDALKARQVLWEIDAGISEAIADLADNNFGLARDAAGAARLALQKATLPPGQAAALAPLDGMLKDLGQSAASLSPQAKAAAREARTLLRSAMKTSP
jgi:hypothetical protein